MIVRDVLESRLSQRPHVAFWIQTLPRGLWSAWDNDNRYVDLLCNIALAVNREERKIVAQKFAGTMT